MAHQTPMYRLQVHDVLNPSGKGTTSRPFSVAETDPNGWRLMVEGEDGKPRRYIWRYLRSHDERRATPLDPISRSYLGFAQEPSRNHPEQEIQTVSDALRRAALFHSRLQTPAGCWTADLSCIFFVTPMLIIAWYITGASIPEAHAVALATHAFAIQAADGGWPTYLDQQMPRGRDSKSTLMGTLLMYVALRLMGLSAGDGRMARAREYVLRLGGATYMPCWGKFWLCLLGLYGWEGSDPYPPEMCPWQWYCFPRQIYLPMTYLWEKKASHPSNPLLDEIRQEICVKAQAPTDFRASRTTVLTYQRHIEKSWMLLVINWLLTNVWLRFLRPISLARKAEEKALQLVYMADEQTKSTGLCVIDACLNMIAIHAAEARGSESKRLLRMQDASLEYFFMNAFGGQSQSIHGGHTWDTALALQAMAEAGFGQDEGLRPTMAKAYAYLTDQQHLTDYPNSPPLNHASRLGGWPFTTKYHSWVCSDCTGEALKAIILTRKQIGDATEQLSGTMTAQIRLGVDNLLFNQNSSGGFSSFERIRGGTWLETLNGTELFGKAIVEYDYVECAGSAVTALQAFRAGADAQYRCEEVQGAIDRGVSFIVGRQQRDGSWLGDWGVAYTYAGFFALETLGGAGLAYGDGSAASDVVRRGCDFLVSKQKEDGGWGETMQSIVDRVYTQAEDSHTVQTAWCCLALMHASYPDRRPIERGIRLILSRQLRNGEWKQEQGAGCGIMTTQILYHNYIFHFPMRALHKYIQLYGETLPE